MKNDVEYQTKQKTAQIDHNLNTPKTVIRGNADLLLEEEQAEDSRENIEATIQIAERIAHSVFDILKN